MIFVLLSGRQYKYPVSDVVPRIRYLLNLRGMRFSTENLGSYNAALDLLELNPELGFADSVIAVRALSGEHTLATFDSHFDRLQGLALSNLENFDAEAAIE